jgi:protein O-GlcNAc transferase
MLNRLKRIFTGNPNASLQTAAVSASIGKITSQVELLNKGKSYANLGDACFEEGKFEEAAECYQQAILMNPSHAEALFGLGLVFLQQNQLEKAEYYLRQAVAIMPEMAKAYYFLGTISRRRENLKQAIEDFEKALELKPDAEIIYLDLCYALFQSGQHKLAKDIITKGIYLKPEFAAFHTFLGNLYYHEQDLVNAIACYQKALVLQPDYVEVYLNLGRIFQEQDKLSEAINCYKNALAVRPDFADAHYNLGLVTQQTNRDEAIACYRRVLALNPNHNAAKTRLSHLLLSMNEWGGIEQYIQDVRRANMEAPVTDDPQPPPFSFLSIPGTNANEQKRCAEKWAQREYLPLTLLRPELEIEYKNTPHNKISIGYLSADFREHAVALLMAQVFELHDRSRFHVTAYSYGQDDGSGMRKRLEKAFDKFVDISNDSYATAAKKICGDHIDILVDLTGYTANTKSALLALRPAPVQVNYLGFPGTMGADFMDYLIADRFTIPPDKQKYYTEKVVWMPDCFQANDSTRARPAAPDRKDCRLPGKGMVFCCFNQNCKISPEMFDIWCRLLRAAPDSVLWLPAGNSHVEANLKREAAKRDVAPERLVAAPILHYEGYLARLQCADLFLDTLPFNAGTTCSDALWMGLPVITCAGDAFASRMAGSLLTAIGAPELITYNPEDYYSLALDLAINKEKLGAIRRKIIANRDTSPLFDSVRFTRNLEIAYTKMWEEYAGGHPVQ